MAQDSCMMHWLKQATTTKNIQQPIIILVVFCGTPSKQIIPHVSPPTTVLESIDHHQIRVPLYPAPLRDQSVVCLVLVVASDDDKYERCPISTGRECRQ